MNPFNLDSTNNISFDDVYSIEIWMENRGRKKNTFVSGWTLENTELKTHLKSLKKSLGCNGCVKTITTDKGDIQVIHLQGDRIKDIYDYLIKNSINKDWITIRGS